MLSSSAAANGATTDTARSSNRAGERPTANGRGKNETALSEKEWALIDGYWRAANYLSVGQIYLYDNPLLKQSLTKEHIEPRLLGHLGTTPDPVCWATTAKYRLCGSGMVLYPTRSRRGRLCA